jgi:hypothetical protein
MGWQAPDFEHRLKHGVMPLANLAPGDFVFFSAYALAGLVSPVSSFFLMLLEFYGLQLQHLSANSITLVVIFVHLCEMFVGVRPSVRLFRRFFVMKAASQRPSLILVHCPCLPGQVGVLERRLGSDAGGCSRPARDSCRRADA